MDSQSPQKPTFWSIVLSTFAAAFGVQSDKNRQRDFQHHSIWPFIFAGVIFTVIFVLGLVLLVKWILAA